MLANAFIKNKNGKFKFKNYIKTAQKICFDTFFLKDQSFCKRKRKNICFSHISLKVLTNSFAFMNEINFENTSESYEFIFKSSCNQHYK